MTNRNYNDILEVAGKARKAWGYKYTLDTGKVVREIVIDIGGKGEDKDYYAIRYEGPDAHLLMTSLYGIVDECYSRYALFNAKETSLITNGSGYGSGKYILPFLAGYRD